MGVSPCAIDRIACRPHAHYTPTGFPKCGDAANHLHVLSTSGALPATPTPATSRCTLQQAQRKCSVAFRSRYNGACAEKLGLARMTWRNRDQNHTLYSTMLHVQ